MCLFIWLERGYVFVVHVWCSLQLSLSRFLTYVSVSPHMRWVSWWTKLCHRLLKRLSTVAWANRIRCRYLDRKYWQLRTRMAFIFLEYHIHGYMQKRRNSIATCKRDVTPLLMHWSYVSFALSHRYGLQNHWYWHETDKLYQQQHGMKPILTSMGLLYTYHYCIKTISPAT